MSRLKRHVQRLASDAIKRLPIGKKLAAQIEDLSQEVATLQAKVRDFETVWIPFRADVAPRIEDLSGLQAKVRDLETFGAQLQDSVQRGGGLIPPPPYLQIRVSGSYYPHFVRHGRALLDQLRNSLGSTGKDFSSFDSILDFGCGCGRVLAALHCERTPSQKIYATDIDSEAIGWCSANYPQVAEFSVNSVTPPLAYSDHAFDFIYSVSIFTHLPEDMQFSWLQELRRVTKPGGYLLLTTHGGKHIEGLPDEQRHIVLEKGFYYWTVGNTEGLPDFYQTAYHTPEYIRQRWSEYFEIVAVHERALDGHQDIVICRAR